MPQLEEGVRHGFLSIKDPYFLNAIGGGKTPGGGGFRHVPLDPKGWSLAF